MYYQQKKVFKVTNSTNINTTNIYPLYTEYYMSKSVSHAVSTREPYITSRATGPRVDIGRGLIRHVIHILTCNVHYIIYFNHAFDNTCIQIFTIFLPEQSYFPIQIYHFFNFFHMYSNCYTNVFVSFGPFLIFILQLVTLQH